MKYFLSWLIFMGALNCGWAQEALHHARARWKVGSYLGATGSATYNSTVCGVLESVTPDTHYSDVVTTKGKESELRWHFVKQIDRADVYHFTFTRKVAGEMKTEEEDVNFANRRIVVFQDDYHTIVMEPPNADDLKVSPGL